MRAIRRAVLILILISISYATDFAQEEQQPVVTLGFSERCNNFMRHYCMAGSHEMAVNQVLLGMKISGTPITTKLIQQVARRTPARLKTPPAPPTDQQ